MPCIPIGRSTRRHWLVLLATLTAWNGSAVEPAVAGRNRRSTQAGTYRNQPVHLRKKVKSVPFEARAASGKHSAKVLHRRRFGAKQEHWLRKSKAPKETGARRIPKRVEAKKPTRRYRNGRELRRAARNRPMRVAVVLDQGSHMPVSEMNPKMLRKVVKKLRRTGVTDVRIEAPILETLFIGDRSKWRAEEKRLVRNIEIIQREGLEIEVIVGFGSDLAVPESWSVDREDEYIRRASDNVRDVVRVLSGLGVKRFQVENELNTAGQAAYMQGWRRGQKWWDWRFKERLMSSLTTAARRGHELAVRDGRSSGRIVLTTNLFDGTLDPLQVPKRPGWAIFFNFVTRGNSFETAVKTLGKYVDEIGIDIYPNYVAPYEAGWNIGEVPDKIRPSRVLSRPWQAMLKVLRPFWRHVGAPPGQSLWALPFGMKNVGAHVKKRVERYREILPDKEIYIAEVGIPSQTTTGHTPAGQALYTRDVLQAALESGVGRTTLYHAYDPTRADHLAFGLPKGEVRSPGFAGVNANDPDQAEGLYGLLDSDGEEKRGVATRKRWQWSGLFPRRVTETREFSAWEELRVFLRRLDGAAELDPAAHKSSRKPSTAP